MKLIHPIEPLRDQLRQWRQAGERIAFVPTMGNLHAGHLQLVQQARDLAERLVVSIFVNPMQFNEASDFERYPRTEAQDSQLLAAQGTDLLFLPAADTIYPHGQANQTRIEVPQLSQILEGAVRPGHFTGVATVVNKLFNLVMPDIALFGKKDYQQLLLIRRMVADLDMPVDIQAGETVREADGLAMSSRNSRLDAHQRELAPQLNQQLVAVTEAIVAGQRNFSQLEADAMQQLDQAGMQTEYIAIRQAADLALPTASSTSLVVLGAVRLGDTRLIDNREVAVV